MDLDFVSVHKHAKKELGQYPAILTSHLVNNPYVFLRVVPYFCEPVGRFKIQTRDLLSNMPKFYSVWANFADIYLREMRDRSMRSGTELAREMQVTDWATAKTNLSNRSSGVQIPRDICTRLGRYLFSTRCSWIINAITYLN